MLTLVIAQQHEIACAGIEALLQTRGHSVVARCAHEDTLLRSVEVYRSDMIILAENIVRQEAQATSCPPLLGDDHLPARRARRDHGRGSEGP